MVLEKLGSSLKNTLSKIASSLFVDEKLINELVKDIQRALLQSDVNVKLVFQLTSTIKERIKKEQTPGTLTKKEHLINIVYEELTIFLGKKKNEIKITEKKPFVIMLVGLFGSGKTTTSGKLAKYYTKRGKKVALVGLDIHRPAAMTQLEQIGASINTKTFTSTKKDPIKIYNDYKDELKKYDIVIVDTAGRDALSDDLIQEIKDVTNLINPDETILALSGDIGQAAEKQAKAFHDACNITGVIITKLDGTAKGGGALSACAITNSPVKFIGVGEKPDDLETFNPQGFVGRLLGMGDLEALLEKARDAISKEDAEDLSKKLLKGEFNLLDLYQQMEAMKKMGKIGKLMEMVPGLSSLKIPKDALQVQEEKLKIWKFMMNSLTKEELEDPTIIDNNRIDRISKGSGTKVSDMRDLLKQYKQAKKMVKMLKGNTQNPEQLMKKLGKKQMRVKYK
jgi:signal recognition particle subunit SRP54